MKKESAKYTNGTLVRQLAETVTANIRRGVWPDGMKLPGERQLAENFSVCRSTVVEALKQLAAQGLIEKIPAKGNFVTSIPVPRKIVLVYPEASFGFRPEIDTLEHLFIFQQLQSGIMAEAAKCAVQVTLFCCEDLKMQTEFQRKVSLLSEFDGFIFVNHQLAELQKALAAIRPLAQIRAEVYPEIPGARVVSYDRFPGYRELLEIVKEKGISRSIILCSQRTDWLDLKDREFRETARSMGMEAEYMISDAGTFGDILKNNRSCFFFLNQIDDWNAFSLAARDAHLVPGRDFFCASQGTGLTLSGAAPKLSFLRSPYFEMGREALHFALRPFPEKTETKLLHSELILQETLSGKKSGK